MCCCQKFVALVALLASGNTCLALLLNTHTGLKPRTLLCGTWGSPFQESVFPDLATLHDPKEAGESDIMIARGRWCDYRTFPGKVLYVEGEQATDLYPHPRLYLLSGSRSSNLKNVSLQGWTQLFHVAHTTLFHPFTAADFLKRRNGTGVREKGFMIYMSSHCVTHRERAFDAIVTLARDKFQKMPVARGACHGSHQEMSQWANDIDTRMNNVEQIRGFRFALCMENANHDGYISEKIADAFAAGTIPIWYGTRDVFELFNADAFVYYEVDNPKHALEEIERLENNMTAYEEMLHQPILANGQKTLDKYFSLYDALGDGKLKNKIRKMLGV